MEKEFVSYEQAVALKELGLDEVCFSTYTEDRILISYCNGTYYFPAPLKQQVFRWFREMNIHGFVIYSRLPNMSGNQYYYTYLNRIGWNNSKPYKTYEEAESACIDRLIEIVKQQHGN